MSDELTKPLTDLARAAYEQGYKHGAAEVARLRAKLRDEMQTTAALDMQDLDEFRRLRVENARLREALNEAVTLMGATVNADTAEMWASDAEEWEGDARALLAAATTGADSLDGVGGPSPS